MSVLGNIEEELVTIIQGIDGSEQTITGLSTPYTYATVTASVNLRDDTIGVIADKIQGNVNYNIEEFEEDNTSYELGTCNYSNSVLYTITAEPKCKEFGISRNIISEEMNKIIEDIKYVLYRYNTLNNTCFGVQYVNSRKQFTNTNDMINSGRVIITIRVQYGQHGSNPSIPYNNNFMN